MLMPAGSDARVNISHSTLHPCARSVPGEHGRGRILFATDLVEVSDSRCSGDSERRWSSAATSTAHEVQVVRRGAYAREVRGAVTLVHAGLAVFTNPGDEVRIAHPVTGGDACSIFRISAAGLEAVGAAESDDDPERRPRFGVDDPSLDGPAFFQHQLAVNAARRASADSLLRLAAEERALDFLRRVTGCRSEHGSGSIARIPRELHNRRAREYVMRVRAVIAQHHREPLTLSTVAAKVGCSPFHLSRIVSAHEGVPIHRLIIRHRLRQALERVLGTREPLSSIALDMGFASQSHFGDSFRREFGHPPGVARRMGAPASSLLRASRTHALRLHPLDIA